MKIGITLYLALIFTVTQSCSKFAATSNCYFDYSPVLFPSKIYKEPDGPHIFDLREASEGDWSGPCLIPNSGGSFLYLRNNYKDNFSAICLADPRNCKTSEVLRGQLNEYAPSLSISNKGMVVFESAFDHGLYTIPLGSKTASPVSINDKYHNYPLWEKSGTKIISSATTGSIPNQNFITINLEGATQDTFISSFFRNGDCAVDGTILTPTGPTTFATPFLALIKKKGARMESRRIVVTTDTLNEHNFILCAKFGDGGNIYYCNRSGLYSYSIAEKESHICIRSAPHDFYFISLSISDDFSYCLAEKEILEDRNGIEIIRHVISRISLSDFSEELFATKD